MGERIQVDDDNMKEKEMENKKENFRLIICMRLLEYQLEKKLETRTNKIQKTEQTPRSV